MAMNFERGSKVVAAASYPWNRQGGQTVELPEIPWNAMEPAIRIERTTCGLRISDSPTSDNLTPQETTTQDALDMGPDGAGLSCPGSNVVAVLDSEKQEKL